MPQERRNNALLLAGILQQAFGNQQQGGGGQSPIFSLIVQDILAKERDKRILDRQIQGQEAIESRLQDQQIRADRMRQEAAVSSAQRASQEQQRRELVETLTAGSRGDIAASVLPSVVSAISGGEMAPLLSALEAERTRMQGGERVGARKEAAELVARGDATPEGGLAFAREAGATFTPDPRGGEPMGDGKFRAPRLPEMGQVREDVLQQRLRGAAPPPEPVEPSDPISPFASLPGGEDFFSVLQSTQKEVFASDAYSEFQNTLASAVEADNLVAQARELQAADETQGVGQVDKQLATLLARSLETGRLTDQDIQRATGESDRAFLDSIHAAYARAVAGQGMLEGEREVILKITKQRALERARPILESEIELRLRPFQGLPPELFERAKQALDINQFIQLAPGGVAPGGVPPAVGQQAPAAPPSANPFAEEFRRRGLRLPGGG